MTSAIWSPTVKTGFNEVIGSWKIIEISRPRMERISAGDRHSRSYSVPASGRKTMRPVIRAVSEIPPAPTRRSRESAVTDLPEPVSPTTASVSPRSMRKLTPSTAFTVPAAVRKWTFSSSMSSSGASIGLLLMSTARR